MNGNVGAGGVVLESGETEAASFQYFLLNKEVQNDGARSYKAYREPFPKENHNIYRFF